MNVAAMQQLLQDHGYTTDTAAPQLDFLNAAYREIHSQSRWPFLETVNSAQSTVVGQQTYVPPMTDWRNIDAIRISQPAISNYVPIEYKDPQELMDMAWVNPTETATPRYWTMYASEIWFFPTPDGVYNITYYYIKEPADLVLGTDIPALPVPYHDVIVSGAICRIAFRERDWIALELWTQKYADGLTKMKEEYRLRQRQTSSEVKRSGWYNTEVNYPLTSTGF